MENLLVNHIQLPSLGRGRGVGAPREVKGGGVIVIKVGGAVVEDPAQLAILLDEFVRLEGPKVLVHGGGRTATNLAKQLGIESQMVGGRRITDAEMLRVVTMVYGGLVNKNIVAQLQARGVNALGLTGADMNLIRAHRRPVTPEGIDFGFVGDVDCADGARLAELLASGITPVIAPLTHDGEGHLLNTNADTMAQTVATALAASVSPPSPSSASSPSFPSLGSVAGGLSAGVSLTFCFELPGVLRDPADPASLIPRITESDFRALVADGGISGGMIPKLENAFSALRDGVSSVRITHISALQGGTLIM
ncbi:MAG: acetylglutamate kinase [Bacteroidaceae bacterium]|nr:acetylglutamate kinase [Bacteroidaceae bacterium]